MNKSNKGKRKEHMMEIQLFSRSIQEQIKISMSVFKVTRNQNLHYTGSTIDLQKFTYGGP